MGCEISQTKNPPIGNSAFNISPCDPFLNARLQGGYIITKVKPWHRHVMVRMHVPDDFSFFYYYFIFFRAKQTAAQLTTRRMWQSALSERQTLETAVTRSAVCLLDCELGRAAYVIGSHQLWQSSDSLLQTDWKQLWRWWWGGDTPWFDALSLGSNLLSPPQPSRWRRSPRFWTEPAPRFDTGKSGVLVFFFFFFSPSASFPSSVEALLI